MTPTIAGQTIEKVSDTSDWIKMLVYGDPGAGKTTLLGSAADVPEMCPVLIVDIEGGMKSIRNKWPQIEVIRIKDTLTESGRVKSMAWDNLFNLYEELKVGKYDYKTIIIDSVSEAYNLAMLWVLKWMLESRPDRDPDLADKREYAKARAIMLKMMRSFRDLDRHVLFTSLKSTKEDQGTGQLINYIPALPGKLAYEVPGFIDEVLYLDMVMKKDKEGGGHTAMRRLLSQPVNKYLAKDRSDNLPMTLENPTMSEIARLILETKVKATV